MTKPGDPPRILPGHGRTQGRHHFLGEELQLGRVIRTQNQSADPVFAYEGEQFLDPLLGGTGRAADVEQPADLAGVTPGLGGRLVDDLVAPGQVAGLQVGQ
jgi:hypothetical protein